MGKNLYEPPRDLSKWHTQKESHDQGRVPSHDERKAHLEELKKRFQKKKK